MHGSGPWALGSGQRFIRSKWCKMQGCTSQLPALSSQLSALTSQLPSLSSQLSAPSSQLSALSSQQKPGEAYCCTIDVISRSCSIHKVHIPHDCTAVKENSVLARTRQFKVSRADFRRTSRTLAKARTAPSSHLLVHKVHIVHQQFKKN